ncbi:MAG: dihydroorotate dehydrogenase [Thermoplasmata archaeon]|nr:dihydroorotate dehydrogenase [Thermoplasmata archaeon]
MNLETSIAGLRLRNPTMLASGILGQTGQSLLRVAESGGAGALVTKSIGLESRTGHGNPSVIEVDNGLLNAMGLPNPGIDNFEEEIRVVKEGGDGIPIFGSIFAKGPSEFSLLAGRMAGYGVDAIELNLSCPHASGYGIETGSDPEEVSKIVEGVVNTVDIPVFAKLSPMVPNIASIAEAVEKAGGHGIVAINTMKAMKIEPEIGKPVLSNKMGGLSGPAIKPVGVRAVYEIASEVKIPIIGVGGILTGQDAIEYFMAGASAVQIGSGVHYRGIDIFKKVCAEIEEFMKANGYTQISEMRGIVHPPKPGV